MSKRRPPTALELIERSMPCPEKIAKSKASQRPSHKPPRRLHANQVKIWRDIEPTIELRTCDLFMFETLVCLIDQQRALQRAVNKDGPIVKQRNGCLMHNPAATALRQIEPLLTRCFKELGMSPATRIRLKMDNRTTAGRFDQDSRWAEF